MSLGVMRAAALSGVALLALQPGLSAAKDTSYKASVEVIPGEDGASADTVRGTVFVDANRDGVMQDDETGVAEVMVSNGRDVVLTGEDGTYALPAMDDMTVFITKPATHDVPVDADNIPQFHYHHKPEGSPQLRFGGLEPTGPLPQAINFPLIEMANASGQFSCVIMGDTQPYSNLEVSYVRDTVAAELAAMDMADYECVIVEGDVMGDDLGLFPRYKQIMAVADTPVYLVAGNHDLDFDATTDQHSFDTFRREFGPAYYSFDIGDVHFVVLDNVVYPCTEHEFCGEGEDATYNGRVTAQQMEWLANDLANVADDKLVVFNSHIPFVTFMDAEAAKHQTDNVEDIYALVEGREALSLSGHTHTLEQLRPGEGYAGWQEAVGVGDVPFPHIVTGAPSGSWWSGDFDASGAPMALTRLGGPRGYLLFEFDGNQFEDTFKASGKHISEQMSIGVSTPSFRAWYTKLADFVSMFEDLPNDEQDRRIEYTPPVNINDLGDTKILTPDELDGESFITVNFWNGSKEATVEVEIGGQTIEAARTQEGEGEEVRQGVEFADPYATQRQMQVARYAYESMAGNDNTQSMQLWTGYQFPVGAPQPLQEWMIADQSIHLWRAQLPADLPEGAHNVTVTATDRFGREYTDNIAIEVMGEKPPMFFRKELFAEPQS